MDLYQKLARRYIEFPGPVYTIADEEMKQILDALATTEMAHVPVNDLRAIIARLQDLIGEQSE